MDIEARHGAATRVCLRHTVPTRANVVFGDRLTVVDRTRRP